MSAPATPRFTSPMLLAFAGCTLIWGSTFLFIRIGNDSLPPFWAAALRLLLASAILGAILAVRRQPLPGGRALGAAVGYGLFQFGINFPLLYWGEMSVSSGLSAVIFATIPVSSALLSAAFGVEKLSAQRVFGGIVSIAGIAIVFSGEHDSAGALPIAAVFSATVFAVIGSLLLKRGPRQSPIGANCIGTAVGGVVCVGISLLAREQWALPATASGWVSILYLTMAGSVGAFVLYAWLVNHWDVSRLGFMAVIIPLIALTLGVLFRGERLGSMTFAGVAVVLAGVAIGLDLLRLRAAPART